MPRPVSALGGDIHQGYVTVRDPGPVGMVTLKADLGAAGEAVAAAAGAVMPAPRRVSVAGDRSILWMAPDEVLILGPRDAAAALVRDLSARLEGQGALVADVSDARAVLTLEGAGVREVLAKVCPADLRPGVLPEGEMRRTRLAQVPCGFWLSAPDRAHVIVFRSVARYAFEVLAAVSAPGSEVGLFQ